MHPSTYSELTSAEIETLGGSARIKTDSRIPKGQIREGGGNRRVIGLKTQQGLVLFTRPVRRRTEELVEAAHHANLTREQLLAYVASVFGKMTDEQ
jgi:hypothetical protein